MKNARPFVEWVAFVQTLNPLQKTSQLMQSSLPPSTHTHTHAHTHAHTHTHLLADVEVLNLKELVVVWRRFWHAMAAQQLACRGMENKCVCVCFVTCQHV